MASPFLRARLVDSTTFTSAFRQNGAIYFVREQGSGCIKIGHSRDPWKRLSDLQTGNRDQLKLIGVVAAERRIERIIHEQHCFARATGEWFADDLGELSHWLHQMTYGHSMCRNEWTLVPGREFYISWCERTRSHTKHLWNPNRRCWKPPIDAHR